MHMVNILRDPFALATTLVSVVREICSQAMTKLTSKIAWIIVFISSVVYAMQRDVPMYPPYCWFCLAFMFCLISAILVVVLSNTVHVYRLAIVGFLAAGLILATSSVNNLIYTSKIASELAAAGFIVLSAVNVKVTFSYPYHLIDDIRLYGFFILVSVSNNQAVRARDNRSFSAIRPIGPLSEPLTRVVLATPCHVLCRSRQFPALYLSLWERLKYSAPSQL
jgi:hypothetical protein